MPPGGELVARSSGRSLLSCGTSVCSEGANIRGCEVFDRRDAQRRGRVLGIHTGGLHVRVARNDGSGPPEAVNLDVRVKHDVVVVPLSLVAQLGLE